LLVNPPAPQEHEAVDPAHLVDTGIAGIPPIHAVFQPIVRAASGLMEGYEALTRGPMGSPMRSPGAIFEAARRAGEGVKVELLALEMAARTFADLDMPGRLFLNVSPSLVAQRAQELLNVARSLRNTGLRPERVVIEFTEGDRIHDHEQMLWSVRAFRALGFQIALDDLGEGFASLRMWKDLEPEIVKVDQHFVRGIDSDPWKRQFLRAIQDIALAAQTQLVAEGVETAAEYKVVQDLKLSFAQGFFIAHPSVLPPRVAGEWVTGMARRIQLYPEIAGVGDSGTTAYHLAVRVEPATPRHTGQQVYERFVEDPALHAVPVVENGKPLGLISRYGLIDRFARPFRRELYGHKSCIGLMNPTPLVVEHTVNLQEIGQRLTASSSGYDLADGFIITQDGYYVGVSTGQGFLRELSELQIRTARYANPLTLLPGNVPITLHIQRLIESRLDFCVCHADLDYFKPYNDLYGYQRGDEMLQLVANILLGAVDRNCDLVGHVGGDDYIMIFQSTDWVERVRAALAQFEAERLALFAPEDIQNNGFSSLDRRGQPQFFPLTGLSVGAVEAPGGVRATAHEISARAVEAKAQAKKEPGNALFIDRRAWGQQNTGRSAALPAAAGPSGTGAI
jgi:EAL domain-containing protein (putative c-di-GMP-specific phosphodiesterase class I)/GGDEF domain-containing protein